MEKRTFENPIIGDKVTFLKTSHETNGEYTLVDVHLAAGGGNNLHYHKAFSERFEPISGDLSVQAGRDQKVLQPGESFTVPPLVMHNFRNNTDKPIHFRVELRPGHEGFENTIKIGYGLAYDGRMNKKGIPGKFAHLALLLTLSDTNLPGIYTLLTSVMRWSAARARKKGTEKELMETYCR